jgi:uncharacterized OsmC-like protein
MTWKEGREVPLDADWPHAGAEKVERAIALSVEKYCSASAMIAKTATISHDFEVLDTATEEGAR